MFSLILTVLFLGLAAVVPFLVPNRFAKVGAAVGFVLMAFVTMAMTSVISIQKDHIGLKYRSIMATNLPAGRIMMPQDGEGTIYKGPQPDWFTEGTYFIPFVNVFFDIKEVQKIEVPPNRYLKLVARDGKDLPKGETMAPEWQGTFEDMLNPTTFLNGGGYKGSQLTVLPPGKYAINTDFWGYSLGEATEIETGQVGVVRSNVANGRVECPKVTQAGSAQIQATLVPRGCRGVWAESLEPNKYYLHDDAYKVTIMSTRATSWVYAGGYKRRTIALTVGDDGSIKQQPDTVPVGYEPSKHAGQAIIAKTVDGQEVPIEVRLQAQVQANSASRVVAGVGDLTAVEDRVVAPIVNDIVRQIAATEKALDLMTKRQAIIEALEKAVIPEAAKAGVTVTEVRIDDMVIPPEVTLPQRRTTLAASLATTYAEEKKAAEARKDSENAIAVANQQGVIVAAQMKRDADKMYGEGERDRLTAVAEGQKAQLNVIGRDKTVELQMFERLMQAVEKNPDIIKVPVVNVQTGNGGSLEGAAAVLGASSNISQFIGSTTSK